MNKQSAYDYYIGSMFKNSGGPQTHKVAEAKGRDRNTAYYKYIGSMFEETGGPQTRKVAEAKEADESDVVAEAKEDDQAKGTDESDVVAEAEEKTPEQLLIEERKRLDAEWEIEAEKWREAKRQKEAEEKRQKEAKDGHSGGKRRSKTCKKGKKRRNKTCKKGKKHRTRHRSHRSKIDIFFFFYEEDIYQSCLLDPFLIFLPRKTFMNVTNSSRLMKDLMSILCMEIAHLPLSLHGSTAFSPPLMQTKLLMV